MYKFIFERNITITLQMCVPVCVGNYLVICPDVSSEDRKVVKTKRHIIANILVQPLVIWTRVTMEKHTLTLPVAKNSADTHKQQRVTLALEKDG